MEPHYAFSSNPYGPTLYSRALHKTVISEDLSTHCGPEVEHGATLWLFTTFPLILTLVSAMVLLAQTG